MNAERLSRILTVLNNDVVQTKLASKLNAIATNLKNAISTPNEKTQRSVETALNQLLEKVSDSECMLLSSGMKANLNEIWIEDSVPVSDLVGSGLCDQLQSIFSEGFTSVKALDRVRDLSRMVTALTKAVSETKLGMETLGIQDETLNEGQSLVGIVIPRLELEQGLSTFNKELKYFERILQDLGEVVDGKVENYPVHSLHASDFGVEILTSLSVAGSFATIIGGVKAAFDLVRDYKKLKMDAQALRVPDSTIKQLVQDSEAAMKEKLDEVHCELFQHCKIDDEGRVNELKCSMKLNLNGVANRLDRGFSFEVRTELPDKSDTNESVEVRAIRTFGSIKFEEVEGARILELDDGSAED